MNSWRDSVSQAAQDDLDNLYAASLHMACELLEKNQEFYPFAFALSVDDEMTPIAVHLGSEFPDSNSVIANLKVVQKSRKHSDKASALTSDVFINQRKSSAIDILMEHREGIALEVIVPYSIHGVIKKKVKLGTIITTPADLLIWPAK
ncbi:MAG: hypothetical protein LBU61_03505 [Coriobacteriales bacterium]|jgi:hypothetical protein|nr:hypothetical protein [Coriobacteriales bacterium]